MDRFEFALEMDAWPVQHILNPLFLYFLTQDVSISIAMAFIWELLEALSFISIGSYFGGNESIENHYDSLIGDPLQGIVGTIFGCAVGRALHIRPIVIYREGKWRRLGFPALFPRAVLGKWNAWMLIRAIIIGACWSGAKVTDWWWDGDTGYWLGYGMNTLVVVMLFGLTFWDRVCFDGLREVLMLCGTLWLCITLLTAVGFIPTYTFVTVDGTALFIAIVSSQLSALEKNSWKKKDEEA
ncbi:hypothetical protein J8273_4670 [Carpediemonas membranifera]|uniref:Uncharacterized protein n=1 Tax=Carpediemonas membranifera TaxID=201153 RepID=A0A8J6BBB9_9EUKA|nr:hypothetical protein J8273_4670 [Carpediemonas membranifera]|eukprot:KAG9393807.1 hypothetical protein J8273_4670 [Carpediemonas membranifera]